MKNAVLIVGLGLSLLPLHSARAQTQAKKTPTKQPVPSGARSETPPSWVFLLETKTQWLLVLQEHRGVPGDIAANGKLDAQGKPGFDEKSGAFPDRSGSALGHNNAQGRKPPASTAANKKVDIGSGSPTVFEGNTNDIPLEEPTRPSLGLLPSSGAIPVIFPWERRRDLHPIVFSSSYFSLQKR